MNEVLYLYGFLPEGTGAPGPDLAGLEDRPVEILELDGFAAAVSRLPEATYGEAPLAERVGDLRWMAHRGFLHERVVTWFVDRGGIVPVRFLTLHRSLDSFRASAAEGAPRIRALLARFDGLREWNLKVALDEGGLLARIHEEEEDLRELDRTIEAASPGRRYLLERRRDRLARERIDEVARRLASEFLQSLAGYAVEVERLPVARTEGEARVVVHAALLVAREREAEMEAEADGGAERLARLGIDARLTGPWAPYRFVEGEVPGTGGDS